METLKERQSTREFSPEKLPLQVLSNVLWAAFGVNRPSSGGRTAPSARNWQEIDLYVATSDGVYRFDAKAPALQIIRDQDIRELTGKQSWVTQAPVNLVYVADRSRMGADTHPAEKDFYAAADTGFISQNVYLYCASEGLATVVRGAIDKRALAKALQLRTDQVIILAQSVGYPLKTAKGPAE
jgi:SagB-type dehydrogenase family enzyme